MRSRMLSAIALAVACVLVAGAAFAGTFRVPSEYADIQSAFTAAGEGDTVLVAPGTYTGPNNRDIEFGGINRVVMSTEGADSTIIDCEGASRAFLLFAGEDSTSVVAGFTITNGSANNGAGIYVSDAAAIIEHCVFSDNTASSNGGGIYYGYAPTQGYIRNCIFHGNTAVFRGGGISAGHGWPPNYAPRISDCVFYDNSAGTGGSQGGGAVFTNSCPVTLTRCTAVGNSGGPGAGAFHGFGSGFTVRNSIIAYNAGGSGVYNVTVEICLLYLNEGTDFFANPSPAIMELDPLFCDLAGRDLTLCGDSSCLPGAANNPWGEAIGALGTGCGDCGTGTEKESWGSIKARLRQ